MITNKLTEARYPNDSHIGIKTYNGNQKLPYMESTISLGSDEVKRIPVPKGYND